MPMALSCVANGCDAHIASSSAIGWVTISGTGSSGWVSAGSGSAEAGSSVSTGAVVVSAVVELPLSAAVSESRVSALSSAVSSASGCCSARVVVTASAGLSALPHAVSASGTTSRVRLRRIP